MFRFTRLLLLFIFAVQVQEIRAEWPPDAPDPPASIDPRIISELEPPQDQRMQDVPRGMKFLAPAYYAFSCAVGSDGSIYFPEFNNQRLLRYTPSGDLEVIKEGLSGMYGLAVDTDGTIFIGVDAGDAVDAIESGVLRVRPDGQEDWIFRAIRRPRQLAIDPRGYLYAVFETGSIWRYDMETGTKSLFEGGLVTPQGVAIGNDGSVYYNTYGRVGTYGVMFEGGKVFRRTSGGETSLVAEGFWRARGLAYSSSEDCLYLTTEANAWDQGNSGLLVRIDSSGSHQHVLQGIDYPQFPAVMPGGGIVFTSPRDSMLAVYDPGEEAVLSTWSGEAGVEVYAASGTFVEGGDGAGAGYPMRIVADDLTISGRIIPHGPGPVNIWVRAPQELFDRSLVQYPEQTPEAPGPGFYELPEVDAHARVGVPGARVAALRRHVRCRWPMTYPDGVETAQPDFNESPEAYLVNVVWKPDEVPPANPVAAFDDGISAIYPASTSNWTLSGEWTGTAQGFLGAALASPDTNPASYGVFDLSEYAGESVHILVTWHSIDPFRARGAEYTVYDDTGVLATADVDQRLLAHGQPSPGDIMAGWQPVGESSISVTPSTRLRISQKEPVTFGTEYLHVDGIMVSSALIVDTPTTPSSGAVEHRSMSVGSTGPSGLGHHWGMQGAGYWIIPPEIGQYRVVLQGGQLPEGEYQVDLSWAYTESPRSCSRVMVQVNGQPLPVALDQDLPADGQSGGFVPGNSVGTFSGFYTLPGIFPHTLASPLEIQVEAGSCDPDGGEALVFDMVRVRAVGAAGVTTWYLF